MTVISSVQNSQSSCFILLYTYYKYICFTCQNSARQRLMLELTPGYSGCHRDLHLQSCHYLHCVPGRTILRIYISGFSWQSSWICLCAIIISPSYNSELFFVFLTLELKSMFSQRAIFFFPLITNHKII